MGHVWSIFDVCFQCVLHVVTLFCCAKVKHFYYTRTFCVSVIPRAVDFEVVKKRIFQGK